MSEALEPSAASAAGPLPPRAARLAAELDAWPRRTVTLAELWSLFAAADPASTTRPSRRADLASTLSVLEQVGAVRASRTSDSSAQPPLPTRLTLPALEPTPGAAALARRVPWRPELAWASSARLTVGQVGVLQTVNGWLRDRGRDSDVLPTRERSLQLFGAEKRLDALLSTSLFAPGRLSLELLRTFRAHPPLPVRRVGDGPVLLVAENADTFDSLVRTLTPQPGLIGLVGWGAGAGFEASVLSVGELAGVHSIAYFGDLDADGLRIPASASATATAAGLPPVRPAVSLYELLLEVGSPQPGQTQIDDQRAADLAGWLGEPLGPRAAKLLIGGQRLPQEAVSMTVLARGPFAL